MKKLLDKLQRGAEVVYGAIGGSITEGAIASCHEKCYVERYAAWWRHNYEATVRVVNAGIGASNSLFGVSGSKKTCWCIIQT